MFEIVAHPVVLRGEERSVQDDAERHARVEHHVVHDDVEQVLEAEPQVVVDAAVPAPGAVTVVVRLCKDS